MRFIIGVDKMPATCVQCPYWGFDKNAERNDGSGIGTNVCIFTHEEIWNTQRGELCVLTEIPWHGELIDKSGLDVLSWSEEETKDKSFTDGVMFVLEKLDELPVIIPADGFPEEEKE